MRHMRVTVTRRDVGHGLFLAAEVYTCITPCLKNCLSTMNTFACDGGGSAVERGRRFNVVSTPNLTLQ
jgi:hypothetical protein